MIAETLERLLSEGEVVIGEIVAIRTPGGSFEVRHRSESSGPARTPDIRIFTKPAAARDLARYDRLGHYRSLRGAPPDDRFSTRGMIAAYRAALPVTRSTTRVVS